MREIMAGSEQVQLPDLDRFSLHVTVYIDPSNVPKFYEAFKTAFDAVRGEEVLLYFEVYEDPTEPGQD